MVERLYGVEHSVVAYNFFSSEEKPVCPSGELIGKLSALPEGTLVGVEFSPEARLPFRTLKDRLSDGREIRISPASKYYWRKIVAACERFKLQIVYLDDFATCKEAMEKSIEAEAYRQKLKDFSEQLRKEGSIPSETDFVRDWREAGYRADIQAEYIFVVSREEKIIDNIKKTNPSIVIIERVHGDIIFLNRELLEAQGVSFEQYLRERASSSRDEIDYFKRLSSFIDGEEPDPSAVEERKLLERRYNAVTQWRVLPERKPDFIGTWSPELRNSGLFEIYVEERRGGGNISGTIEDTLGTASFVGEWDGENIRFIKEYYPGISGQSRLPIYYEGKFVNGQFQGDFIFLSPDGNPCSDLNGFLLYRGDQFIADSPLHRKPG